MTYYEYKHRLRELRVTCVMNLEYHHDLEDCYGRQDKNVRVAVGALAVIGLVLSVPGVSFPLSAFAIAIVTTIAAVALNIISIGDREKTHGELFRLWSDMLADANREEFRTYENDEDGEVHALRAERLNDLCWKVSALSSREPVAQRKLLDHCHSRALMQLFGVQSTEELRERYAAEAATSSAAAAEATAVASDAAGAAAP